MGFFVQYMKNADLGNIAYSHLATADFDQDGIKSDKCIELAQIHSDAVDYPKTGRPASIPNELRPRHYPHYMERKRGSYRSHKILGQLYDGVTIADFSPAYDNLPDRRILRAFRCSEEHLQAARKIKLEYDTAVRRIMAQHDIKTEFEVWSTFALERNKNHGEFKFGEILSQSVDALKEQYRDICAERAGGPEADILEPFVAAMYTVTAEEMQIALRECESWIGGDGSVRQARRSKIPSQMPLLSFPWLFPIYWVE